MTVRSNGPHSSRVYTSEGGEEPTLRDQAIAWVILAQGGDPEAFDALVATRRPLLLSLLTAAIGDVHEAEDALQDGLWLAFRRIPELREPLAFDSWLRRVVINAARSRLRATISRLRREGRPFGNAQDLEALVAGGAPSPLDGLSGREHHRELLNGISRLPAQQRRMAGLVWVAGLSPRQAARLAGLPVGHAYAALHRARGRLTGTGGVGKEMAVAGAIRIRGGSTATDIVAHLRRFRPDLTVEVARTLAEADVHDAEMAPNEPPTGAAEEPPQGLLPLDGLADGRLDLEPFSRNILRRCWQGRPYWLPHDRHAEVLAYNADLFARAGIPAPRRDWTWDAFEGACRRLLAAGVAALAPVGGRLVAGIAEQLGATAATPEPVREAAEFVRRWRGAGFIAPVPHGGWGLEPFYAGLAAMAFTHSAHPVWAFAQPEYEAFRWGVVPMPRVCRSDPPRPVYWRERCVAVRATAADPVAAFAVVAAVVCDGPLCGGRLPDYRTPEIMRSWAALPLPLGKGCLLDLDAATDPLSNPPWLWWEATEPLEALAGGTVGLDEGMAAVRAAIGERTAAGLRGDGRSGACGFRPAPAS